ncbi:MAG: hypothetical protein K5683_09055 [Prevotella sp.]|nr:hypothetical protein [Prevotella sp.]
MKHVKILPLPDCQKLIYAEGQIARQIGTMIVVDDEQIGLTESYPIVAGGRDTADGLVLIDTSVYETQLVCLVGEEISPTTFCKFVKQSMHEEIPSSAYELYEQLHNNGGSLCLPKSSEPYINYQVELEFVNTNDTVVCQSSDTAAIYFEAYFEPGNKKDAYNQLLGQLMEYMNIFDNEELGTVIVFRTVDIDYLDLVKRLNDTKIETKFSEMLAPR